MEWMWVRNQLRAAEEHLERAACAERADVVQQHLRRAQQAYASAMAALEHDGMSAGEREELRRRMQELSARLHALEQRSR